MNQIDIPDYQYYVGCNAKGMVCLTALKKVDISHGKFDFFADFILKNSLILSGQGVVQIEPN